MQQQHVHIHTDPGSLTSETSNSKVRERESARLRERACARAPIRRDVAVAHAGNYLLFARARAGANVRRVRTSRT